MSTNLESSVTGWLFLVAAVMLWLGWVLMPVHIGTFFEPGNFAAIHDHLHLWIWLYRVHLFGFLVALMALVALGVMLAQSEVRIVAWPGIAVAGAGLIVGAVAAAFYYHFGAWGAVEMKGLSAAALDEYVKSLRVGTEYVTCLVRFGRVFLGLGQLVLGIGLFMWSVVPRWLGASAVALGLAAMAVTMVFPDNLEFYSAVFHLNVLWFGMMGAVTLRSGLRLVDVEEE